MYISRRHKILTISSIIVVIGLVGFISWKRTGSVIGIFKPTAAVDQEKPYVEKTVTRTSSEVERERKADGFVEPAPASSPCAGGYEHRLPDGTLLCTHGTD